MIDVYVHDMCTIVSVCQICFVKFIVFYCFPFQGGPHWTMNSCSLQGNALTPSRTTDVSTASITETTMLKSNPLRATYIRDGYIDVIDPNSFVCVCLRVKSRPRHGCCTCVQHVIMVYPYVFPALISSG